MQLPSRDILNSVKASLSRNGFFSTLTILWHYAQLQLTKRESYLFYFKPLGHTIQLRKGASDFSVFRQIGMNGEYDIPIPISPKIIVDAGANIGLASLYFHYRFPSATIYSLEPDLSNYSSLKEQVNDIPLVRTFQLALWHKKERLALHRAGVDAWGIQVQQVQNDQGDYVNGIDLASFMNDEKIEFIDLLKIDIEGAEMELFNGEFMYWLSRTRVLIIELHEAVRPGCEIIFFNAIRSIRHQVQRSGENVVVFNLDLL